MEIVIGSAAGKAPIWDHFLLKDLEVVIKYTDDKNVASEVKPQRVAGKYNWTLLPGIVSFDLTLQTSFRFNGTTYPLLKIMQTFAVAGGAEPIRRSRHCAGRSFAPIRRWGLPRASRRLILC